MKETNIIMGIPITVEVVDNCPPKVLESVFNYFHLVDGRFSTYKPDSEISRINRGEISWDEFSPEMQKIFQLSEQTKQETNGYFDIATPAGSYDPSGLVKGWAIYEASKLMDAAGCGNYYIDAGGDIEARRIDRSLEPWRFGIRSPFHNDEIIKVVGLYTGGMATSGTYERGQHIYNPLNPSKKLSDIVSISVIGPNVYEADRFATAAFAMGAEGINFIEQQEGLEGYAVNKDRLATMTSGFEKFVI